MYLVPITFRGGVPSVLVFNGLIIESKFSAADFGLVSPDYIISLIAVFSLAGYAVFRKPNTRIADTWNSGREITSEYTSFAYANNIRLMLRRILRTRTGADNHTVSVIDVFWLAMNLIAAGYRKSCMVFSRKFMNSSIGWYMIYMIVAFMVTIIFAVAL